MIDLFQINTSLNQNRVNILLNLKTRDQMIYSFHNSRGMIPPIISGTSIEKDGLSKFLVLDEKNKGVHVPRFVASDHRLDEAVGSGYHVCCVSITDTVTTLSDLRRFSGGAILNERKSKLPLLSI
jgi:hypothetical protein